MSYNPENPDDATDQMEGTSDDEGNFDMNDALEVIDPEDDTGPTDGVAESGRLSGHSSSDEGGAVGGEIDEEDDETQDDLGPEPEEQGILTTPTRVIDKHTAPVQSVSVSPCGSLVVTGGEDDLAYVWNTYTGQLLLTCTGHKDSVAFVGVSHDSQLVVTADLAGLIQVWRVTDGQIVFTFDTDDIAWLQWHTSSHILFCGTQSGEVWVWLVPRHTTKTISGNGAPVLCGTCTPDGKRLLVGYQDGCVRVVDIKSEVSVMLDQHNCHRTDVTCVACHEDNVLAVAGAEDGAVKVFNTNSGKVLFSLDVNKYKSPSLPNDVYESVEGVGFCTASPNLLVVVGGCGTMLVYDVSKQTVRHTFHLPDGATCLTFPPASPTAYVGFYDGRIRQVDVVSGKQVAKLMGHRRGENILSISLDRTGKILASGSDDNTANIYSVGTDSRGC